MTLFEDKDVMVLNKPYGLAVQGGSGTTRHIDGMLASLAKGDRRPVLVHRLDRDTSGVLLIAKNRRTAAELGEVFRSRQAQENLLGAGRGRAEALAGPHLALSRQGCRAWATNARPRASTAPGPSRPRENARRPPWRRRRAAFADLLRHRRQGRARVAPGCR